MFLPFLLTTLPNIVLFTPTLLGLLPHFWTGFGFVEEGDLFRRECDEWKEDVYLLLDLADCTVFWV